MESLWGLITVSNNFIDIQSLLEVNIQSIVWRVTANITYFYSRPARSFKPQNQYHVFNRKANHALSHSTVIFASPFA